jgi:hypothetical protein
MTVSVLRLARKLPKMKLSDKEVIELNELLDRLVENNLSYDQKKRLEEWLNESVEARRYYVSYLDMSVSLSHFSDESLGDIEKEEESIKFPEAIRFVQPWLPIAALLVFGCYLYFTLPTKPLKLDQVSELSTMEMQKGGKPYMDQVSVADSTVALITKSVGLQWGHKSLNKPEDGSALNAGEISFSRGMAQLEFMQGATAILEGPIEAQLLHTNALSLTLGKLRAHVPRVAVGFSVDLPMGKVVDLGTDFGVEVHEQGSAEVYVYRGQVKYQGIDFEGNEVVRKLSGGEAIFLDSRGVLSSIDMPLGDFAGSADLATRSLENASKRRAAWLKESHRLASDPSTLLYYGFEGHDSWARVLKDETNRENGNGDGAVIGCNWTEGRWPGKGALKFSKDNDRVCLNISKPLSSATLVAWVRVDTLSQHGAPLIFSRPNLDGAVGWLINPAGKLVLEIKVSDAYEKYESAVAFSPDRLGKWVHLASSFDGKNKWVNHFVNGRSFSREKISQAQSITLKKGLLGHFHAFPNRNPNLSLKGSIDEFAIFKSAWDEERIRELFEVGCPQEQSTAASLLIP